MTGPRAGKDGVNVKDSLTPEQIREKSRDWYARQIEILSLAHGASWPANREWVEEYLKAELRERLLAIGWRPKQ